MMNLKTLATGLRASFARLSALSLILIGLLGWGLSAQAQNQSKDPIKAGDAILIMDYSNSMWGQIEGVAKIEIARKIIDRNYGNWNELTNLGILAYGHRRADDCSDIQMIAEPGLTDEAALSLFLENAKPKGKTPLSNAIEEAVQYFDDQGKDPNIILLSDGIESCDRDPCKSVQVLQEQGVNLTAHVIGFGLTGEQGAQIACIATQTGGQYLAAENAGDLDQAFKRSIEQIQLSNELGDLRSQLLKAQDEIKQAKLENETLSQENDALDTSLAALKSTLHECEAETKALQTQLVDLQTENENLRAVIASMMAEIQAANAPLLSAFQRGADLGIKAEGASLGQLAGIEPIPARVEPSAKNAAVYGDKVVIRLSAQDESDMNDLGWTYRGMDAANQSISHSGEGHSFRLPKIAGRYEVAVTMHPYIKRFVIDVQDGDLQTHRVSMNLSRLLLEDKLEGQEGVTFSLSNAEGVVASQSLDGPVALYLPKGDYALEIYQGNSMLRKEISLSIGQHLDMPILPL